eukprot:jgi/Tetstr1/434498/TSEL_023590.t1
MGLLEPVAGGTSGGFGALVAALRSSPEGGVPSATATLRAVADVQRVLCYASTHEDSGAGGLSQLVELVRDAMALSESRIAATWALAVLVESNRSLVGHLAIEAALQQLSSSSEDEQEAAAVLLGKLAGGDVTSAREIVSKGGISLLAGVVGGVSSGNRRCAQEAIQVVAALRLRQPEELDAVAKHAGLLHGLTDLATSHDAVAARRAASLLCSMLHTVNGFIKQVLETGLGGKILDMLSAPQPKATASQELDFPAASPSENIHLIGLLLLEGGQPLLGSLVANTGALRMTVDAIRPDAGGATPETSRLLMGAMTAAGASQYAVELVDAGLPERLVEMLWAEGQNGPGLRLALELAGVIARANAAAACALRREGVVGLLLGAMQPAVPVTRWWLDGQEHEDSVVYPGMMHPDVALSLLDVLDALTRQADKAGLLDIIGAGAVIALLAELRLMGASPVEPGSADVRSATLRILHQLSSSSDAFLGALRECHGIMGLLQALAHPYSSASRGTKDRTSLLAALAVARADSSFQESLRALSPELSRALTTSLLRGSQYLDVAALTLLGDLCLNRPTQELGQTLIENDGVDRLAEALMSAVNDEAAFFCLNALAVDGNVPTERIFSNIMLEAISARLRGGRLRVAPLASALKEQLASSVAESTSAAKTVLVLSQELTLATALLSNGGALQLADLQGAPDEDRAATAARALLGLSAHADCRNLIESFGLGPLMAMLHVTQLDGDLQAAARVLRMLVRDLGAAEVVAGAGGIELCISMLLELPTQGTGPVEYEAFSQAAAMLELFSAVGPDVRSEIVSSGGVLALTAYSIDCANRHDWEGLASAACALRQLAVSQSVTEALADAGATAPLLQLLLEAQDLAGQHRGRLAALETLLSLTINHDIRPAIGDAPVIAAIQVLKVHCGKSHGLVDDQCLDEAEVAASILASMAATGHHERRKIADAGGLELLMMALQHGGHLEESAASALRILALEESLHDTITSLQGGGDASMLLSNPACNISMPPLTARSLARGDTSTVNASVTYSSRSIEILMGMLLHGDSFGRKVAADALAFLADNDDHRERIIQEGGVTALLRLLLESPEEGTATEEVVAAVCALDRLCCRSSGTGQQMAAKVGSAGRRVTATLTSLLADSAAQEKGRVAAAQLLGKVVEAGVGLQEDGCAVPLPGVASVSPLLDILARSPAAEASRDCAGQGLVVASAQALSCLALHEGTRDAMLSQGAAATLLRKLVPPPPSGEEPGAAAHAALVAALTRCLMRVTGCGEGQRAVMAGKGVDILAEVVYGGWASPQAVADGATALSNLTASAKAAARAVAYSRDSSLIVDDAAACGEEAAEDSATAASHGQSRTGLSAFHRAMTNLSIGSTEHMYWSDILSTTTATELGGAKRPSDGSMVEEAAARLAAAELSQLGVLGDNSMCTELPLSTDGSKEGTRSQLPTHPQHSNSQRPSSSMLAAVSVGRDVLTFQNDSFSVEAHGPPKAEDELALRRKNSLYHNELSQMDCSAESLEAGQPASELADAVVVMEEHGGAEEQNGEKGSTEVVSMSVVDTEESPEASADPTGFLSCQVTMANSSCGSSSATTMTACDPWHTAVEEQDSDISGRAEDPCDGDSAPPMAQQQPSAVPQLALSLSEPSSPGARGSLDPVRISVEPWLMGSPAARPTGPADRPHREPLPVPHEEGRDTCELSTEQSLNTTDQVFCFPPTASPPASAHSNSGSETSRSMSLAGPPAQHPKPSSHLPPSQSRQSASVPTHGQRLPSALEGEAASKGLRIHVSADTAAGVDMPPLVQDGSNSPTTTGRKRGSSASASGHSDGRAGEECAPRLGSVVESCSAWMTQSKDWSPGELPRLESADNLLAKEDQDQEPGAGPIADEKPAHWVPTLRVDKIPLPDLTVLSDEEEDRNDTTKTPHTTFCDSLQTTHMDSSAEESFLAGEDALDGLGPQAPSGPAPHTPRCHASRLSLDESGLDYGAGGAMDDEGRAASLAHMVMMLEMNNSTVHANGQLNSTVLDDSIIADVTDLSICSAAPGSACAVNARLLSAAHGAADDWQSALLGELSHQPGAESHVLVLQTLLHCLAVPEAGRSSAISSSDSLPAIVALLLHGTPAGQQLAARTIASLVGEEPGMRSAVVEEAGCLAGLVDLLDSSKQEMETREWAAAALCCLSWAEEHRLRIASTQHAVPRLIALVRSALRKSVEGAVRAAAGTLSNLALSPELVQLLLGSGAVSCLVACMKSSSPAVRTSGAHALKALAMDEAAGTAIVDAGALQALVRDLDNLEDHGLSTAAAACLRNLMLTDAHVEALEAAGGVKALVALVAKVSLSRRQQPSRWLDEAAQEAAGALQNAAASHVVAQQLTEAQPSRRSGPTKPMASSSLLAMLMEAEKCAAPGVRDSLSGVLYNLAGSATGRAGIVATPSAMAVLLDLLDIKRSKAGLAAAETAAAAIGLLATGEKDVRSALSASPAAPGLASGLLALMRLRGRSSSQMEARSLRRTACNSLAAVLWLDKLASQVTDHKQPGGIIDAVLCLLSSADLAEAALGAVLIPPLASLWRARQALIAASAASTLLSALRRGGSEPRPLLDALLALAVDEAGQEAVLQARTSSSDDAVSMALTLLLAPAAPHSLRDSAGGLLARLSAVPAGQAALLRTSASAVPAAIAILRAPVRATSAMQRTAMATMLARLGSCAAGCQAIVSVEGGLRTLQSVLRDQIAQPAICEPLLSVLKNVASSPHAAAGLKQSMASGIADLLHQLLSGTSASQLRVGAAGLVASLACADVHSGQVLARAGLMEPLLAMLAEEQEDAAREAGARAVRALACAAPEMATAAVELPAVEAMCDMMSSLKVAMAISAGTCLRDLSEPEHHLAEPLSFALGGEAGLQNLCNVMGRGCSDAKELAAAVMRNMLAGPVPPERPEGYELFLETLASLISGAATAACCQLAAQCVCLMVERRPEAAEDVSGGGVMEAVVMAIMSEDTPLPSRAAAAKALCAMLTDANVCARIVECDGQVMLLEVAAEDCPAPVAQSILEGLLLLTRQPGLLEEHQVLVDASSLQKLVALLAPESEGGRAGSNAAAPAARLLVELLALPEVRAAWPKLGGTPAAAGLLAGGAATEEERHAAVALLHAVAGGKVAGEHLAVEEWVDSGAIKALTAAISREQQERCNSAGNAAALLLHLFDSSDAIKTHLVESSDSVQELLLALSRVAEGKASSTATPVLSILAAAVERDADMACTLLEKGVDSVLGSLLCQHDNAPPHAGPLLRLVKELAKHHRAAPQLRSGACYEALHAMARDTSSPHATDVKAALSLIAGNEEVDECAASAAATMEKLLGGPSDKAETSPGSEFGMWLVEPLACLLGRLGKQEGAVVRMALSTLSQASRSSQLAALLLSAIRFRGGGVDGRAASATVLERVLQQPISASQGSAVLRVAEEVTKGMEVLVGLMSDTSLTSALVDTVDSPAHAGAHTLIALLAAQPSSITAAVDAGAPEATVALLAAVPRDSRSALAAAQLLGVLTTASREAALTAVRLSAVPRLVALLGDPVSPIEALPHRAAAATTLVSLLAVQPEANGGHSLGDGALSRLAAAIEATLKDDVIDCTALLAGLTCSPTAAASLTRSSSVAGALVRSLDPATTPHGSIRGVLPRDYIDSMGETPVPEHLLNTLLAVAQADRTALTAADQELVVPILLGGLESPQGSIRRAAACLVAASCKSNEAQCLPLARAGMVPTLLTMLAGTDTAEAHAGGAALLAMVQGDTRVVALAIQSGLLSVLPSLLSARSASDLAAQLLIAAATSAPERVLSAPGGLLPRLAELGAPGSRAVSLVVAAAPTEALSALREGQLAEVALSALHSSSPESALSVMAAVEVALQIETTLVGRLLENGAVMRTATLLRCGGDAMQGCAAELLRLAGSSSASVPTVAAAVAVIRELANSDDSMRHLLSSNPAGNTVLVDLIHRQLDDGGIPPPAVCEDAVTALGCLLGHRAPLLAAWRLLDQSQARAVTRASGVKALVRCLMPSAAAAAARSASPMLHAAAAGALARMAAASPELRISVARGGGVEALVGALLRDNHVVKAAAAEGIAVLTSSSDVRRHVARCIGAVGGLVETMVEPEVGVAGRTAAAVALARLACVKDAALLRSIAEAGGLMLAAGLLGSGNPHESLTKALVKGPLVDVLREAGSGFGTACRVDAASALAMLTKDASTRKLAVEAGAVPRVVAMMIRPSNEEKQAGALALRSLTLDERGRLESVRCGAVRPLVELLRAAPPDAGAAAAALSALRSLTTVTSGAAEAVKAGSVEAVVLLLDRSTSAGTRKIAAEVLGNLGSVQTAADVIHRSGAVKLLLDILQQGDTPGSPDAAAAAANAISKMASCRWARSSIVALPGALKALLQLLNSSQSDQQTAAANAVGRLAVDTITREEFLRLGALTKLKQLQASDNNGVASASARAAGLLENS